MYGLHPAMLAMLHLLAADPTPPVPPSTAPPALDAAPSARVDFGEGVCPSQQSRGLFESDHAFPGFIGPISNPILSKDPRSLTEARFLFINNEIDPANPLGAGSFQAFAMQARVALTDRLTLIADKDGYLLFHPAAQPFRADGWLNINAGLKYTLVRDVENQFLVDVGLMYEPPTGGANVFQRPSDGMFTAFIGGGKEFAVLPRNRYFRLPVRGERQSEQQLFLHQPPPGPTMLRLALSAN